jgi:Fe-S-cluster containining protein
VDNKTSKAGLEQLQVLKPLRQLEALYRAFDLAEKDLTAYIGVPICVEHCGRCCEITSPDVWEIEARFLVSSLIGRDGRVGRVVSACEGWLLDRSPKLKTYGIMAGELTSEQWDQMRPEVDFLLQNYPCPFLSEEKRCLIHFARPVVCRCYGVTRMPSRICPRPLAKIESADVRAHIAPDSHIGKKLREMLWETLKSADSVGWAWTYFLPTILYMILEPNKFNAYAADGRIATAKLLRLRTNTAILFQDQLNEIWARETPALAGGKHV